MVHCTRCTREYLCGLSIKLYLKKEHLFPKELLLHSIQYPFPAPDKSAPPPSYHLPAVAPIVVGALEKSAKALCGKKHIRPALTVENE